MWPFRTEGTLGRADTQQAVGRSRVHSRLWRPGRSHEHALPFLLHLEPLPSPMGPGLGPPAQCARRSRAPSPGQGAGSGLPSACRERRRGRPRVQPQPAGRPAVALRQAQARPHLRVLHGTVSAASLRSAAPRGRGPAPAGQGRWHLAERACGAESSAGRAALGPWVSPGPGTHPRPPPSVLRCAVLTDLGPLGRHGPPRARAGPVGGGLAAAGPQPPAPRCRRR